MVSLEELWVRMEIPTGHVPRKTSIKREILSVFNESSESQKSIRPAGVFHTRGFHSNPYGVRIGHAAILNRCIFEWKQLDIHEHQSCSLTTPVSQVDSVSQIFSALLKGCTLVIFTRADMKDVTQFLKDVASKMINRLVIPHYMFYEVLRQLKVLDPDDRVELMKSLLCVKYVVCRGGYIRHVDVSNFVIMKSSLNCYLIILNNFHDVCRSLTIFKYSQTFPSEIVQDLQKLRVT